MRPRHRAGPVGVALVAGIALLTTLTSCSDADDDAADDVGRVDEEGPTTTALAVDPAATAVVADPPTGTDAPVESLASVPEVGVPGLESDDDVCRAWSRYAGSFQVVAVAASFGSDDPNAAAVLEVIAASTVTASYADLIANLPDELAEEAALVADDWLGPFARRADRALAALEAAGADAAAISTIDAAWEAALAGRDPTLPEIAVELPADIQATVDIAAAELVTQLVPIPSDPSLVTDVDVPLTEQFLFDTCPDRGTLGGVDE